MIEQIINGFFCWLNTNDGFLSLLTVVISLAACILSLLSARAAWAQVREMRRQYEEENRPNIEVEFLYENRAYYGLRFVNHGKKTAQNVHILLDTAFIDALPEPVFSNLLRKQEGKHCVIGVGMYYDLFFGTNTYRDYPNKPPAKGKVVYQANGKDYGSEFDIDLESYATIFSIQSQQESLLKRLKEQNNELKYIRNAIQSLKPESNKESDSDA